MTPLNGRRKWGLPFVIVSAAGLSVAPAGPAESAVIDAMRLAEQANYSWVATVMDDARTYDIVGRTRQDGFTRVSMPVVNSIRRRLGRSVTDTQVEFIFRGSAAWVVETDDGWKTLAELPPPGVRDGDTGRSGTTPPSGVRGGPSGSNQTVALPGTGVRASGRGDENRSFSNLQLGLSRRHEELGIIVSNHRDLAFEGEVITGVLTDLGAQLLLVRDGQSQITPVRTTGTFTLWRRAGVISRYQVRLRGALAIDTPAGPRPVEVIQTTDMELVSQKAVIASQFPDDFSGACSYFSAQVSR